MIARFGMPSLHVTVDGIVKADIGFRFVRHPIVLRTRLGWNPGHATQSRVVIGTGRPTRSSYQSPVCRFFDMPFAQPALTRISIS